MNLKSWVAKNVSGNTPLHDTVSNGHHDRIPKELFEPQYFLVRNWFGTTPLHLAMSPGKVKYLPTELIMGRAIFNLFSANYAQSLSAGYFSRLFKNPQLNILVPDRRGITPLHIAAEKGCLNELPEECLQPRHMMTKARNGYTPMHYAMGTLSGTIPSSCFSEESLTIRADNKFTPLDVLCSHILETGDLTGLKSFPQELHTNEIFLRDNHYYSSLLHTLARTGLLAHAPKSIITLENMFLPVNGNAPFDIMNQADIPAICHLELPESAINAIGKEQWNMAKATIRDKSLLEATHEVSVDIF